MKIIFGYLFFHMWIIFGSQGSNSNFYHFSIRFYDSKAGRFLSADPVVPEIQSNKGLSRYAYVYNNPIEFDDPDGHVPNDRSREVRHYEDALEDYETQLLADLGYFSSGRQDEKNGTGGGERVSQVAAFGLREAVRLGRNAPTNASGAGARLLLVAHDVHEAGVMDRLAKLRRPTLAGQTTDVFQAGLAVATRQDMPSSYYGHLVKTPQWQEARRLGFWAGASQTPIMISNRHVDTALTRPIQEGFSRGVRIPILFNVIGGVFGIASSLQYENELAKAVGTLGGLGEITAGVSWAKNSRLLSMSSKASAPVRNAASMRLVGARALGFASGFVGLIALGLEYAASQDHPPPSEEALRYRELHPDVGYKKLNGEPLEPCKGNYCLVEGTLVWTPSGLRRIEELVIGDFVLSPEGRARIILVSKNKVDSWLQVKTSQETLGLTANHQVKVKDRGWILAAEVEVGDQLGDGFEVLEIRGFQNSIEVYNLLAEPTNEFYVGLPRILVRGLGK